MPIVRKRLAALLAVLAMALQGFLPFVTQVQAAGPDFLGGICSVEGAGALAADADPLPTGDGAGKHAKHCALCVMGGDRAALVAALAPAYIVSAYVVAIPAAQFAAARCSTAVSPAQPRAPPVHT